LSKDLHFGLHSSDLLDCDGTGTYLVLKKKMVPFDGNMLGSRAIFGVLIGNFKSSLIVFEDKGLGQRPEAT
jgi:hypothetical protein